MAELSTLSTSPPALGDPHSAPSIPPSSSVLPAPNSPPPQSLPKSALYNNKPLTGHTPAGQSGGSPLTPDPSLSPPKLTAETPLPSLLHEAAPQREESTGKDVIKQETMSIDPVAPEFLNSKTIIPALSTEPSAQSDVQKASPSPDLSPGPNLYPNVHVTHNPNPIMDGGQFTPGQLQTTVGSNPTPAPPASVDAAALATAEEEKPQPLQQAQSPQSQPPPLSPKRDAPNEAGKAELPSTPTRVEHPSPTVPLIHEPSCALPLHNPNPRPAPDTLSYLESASLMSGTLESLSGLGEDGSSVGSDSEINGMTVRRTDKYGFLGGSQYSEGR